MTETSTPSRLVGPFQGALLDMDGTLIDSAENGERAWRGLAQQWQLAAPSPAFFHAVHGTPARHALRRMLPYPLVEAACRELEAIEAADTQGVTALPGAVDLLRDLSRHRMAIVTSSFSAVALARLAAAGIAPPRHMVTCEVITHGKPDPEPFLRGAALLGVSPSSAVAFEDTRPGIRSAKEAGCFVIAVEGLHRAVELTEAHFVVASLRAVSVRHQEDGRYCLELQDVAAGGGLPS